MRLALAPLTALLLSACVATTGTNGGGGVTSATVDPADLGTSSFDGPTVFVPTLSSGTYDEFAAADHYIVEFDGANGVDLGVPGNPDRIHMTWDDALQAYVYVSTDGTLQLTAFNDPANPDIFVFKLSGAAVAPDYGVVAYVVGGNLTDRDALPTTGSATYSGTLEVTDQRANTAGGEVSFAVNLASDVISGALSIEDGTVFGAATFSFDTGIDRGTDGVSFESELTSSDFGTPNQDITNSEILGNFFGDSGQEIGGTLYVNLDGNALAGVFAASK